MLTIRLQRRGRKNDPSFRVIVTESKYKPKTGKYLEMLGSYEVKSGKVQLNPERIKYWMSQGVGVSGTVHNLLVDAKIIEGKKINVLNRKTPIVKEAPAAAPAPAAEAPAAPVETPADVSSEASAKEEAPAAEAPAAEAAPEGLPAQAGESAVAPETPQA